MSVDAATPLDQRELFDRKYRDERFVPLALRPAAMHTTRFDDIARLSDGLNGTLVDFGCGSGGLLAALMDRQSAITRGVGLDISPVRIEHAREVIPRHYPQLAGRVAFEPIVPGRPLPVASASVDVAITCVVLEFVDDVFRAIDELARIVRPGGHLVAAVANAAYLRHVWSLLRSQTPVTSIGGRDMRHWRDHGWDGGALRYFAKQTFGDLLRDGGFEPEAWSGCGKFARLRRAYLNGFGCITVRARRR